MSVVATLRRSSFSLVATVLLGALLAPAIAHADSFKITYEAAGVQSANRTSLCASLGSGTCVVGTESFSNRTSGSGFTTNYGTNGTITGTYSAVQINNADVYGGAGGTGQYAVAFNNTPYSVSLSTTLSSGLNYFGFWLSALDNGNQVTFSKNGVTVYSFAPTDLINALGSCSGTNAYCGNPNATQAGNTGQLYAFVNFFDTNGTFDKISFSESPASGGYESDNHTVGYVTAQSGTSVSNSPVPEPATLSLMGSGMLALVARRRWKK